jgi:hypothetical protein
MTALAVLVVTMVLALQMLGFVAAAITFTVAAVARRRCTAHCEYQHCSKDQTAHSASPMRAAELPIGSILWTTTHRHRGSASKRE